MRKEVLGSQAAVYRSDGCCCNGFDNEAHRERGVGVGRGSAGGRRRGCGGPAADNAGGMVRGERLRVTVVMLKGMVCDMVYLPGSLLPRRFRSGGCDESLSKVAQKVDRMEFPRPLDRSSRRLGLIQSSEWSLRDEPFRVVLVLGASARVSVIQSPQPLHWRRGP